jgi:thermostable 8-oxoguanine DNA glycosylase
MPFVRQRVRRNLAEDKPKVAKSEFWKQLVVCILTSRQRAGPDSPVARLSRTDPFVLSYETCAGQADVVSYVKGQLSRFGVTRFTEKIPAFLKTNLGEFDLGLWDKTSQELEELRARQDQRTERRTAGFIEANYAGIGPKQARNVLQCVGLTRYEIPLDSRIEGWFTRLGWPFEYKLSGKGYCHILDDIQELCRECGVIPCVLDASVFNSVDGSDWTEEKVKGVF